MTNNIIDINHTCPECGKTIWCQDFKEQDLPEKYKGYNQYMEDGIKNIYCMWVRPCDECLKKYYEII